MVRVLALTLSLAAVVTTPAVGATRVAYSVPDGDGQDLLSVRGDAGPNDVRIRILRSGASLAVTDPGGVRAAGRCRSVRRTLATCPAAAAPLLDVRVGGGDDTVIVEQRARTGAGFADQVLLGGAGDDLLRSTDSVDIDSLLDGGAGEDELVGGPGVDVLRGGSGRDRVEARGGNDRIDGGAGSDTLSGGPGADALTYASRRTPVVVDLVQGIGATRGEHDRLRSIAEVFGGRAADRLVGGPQDERLHGARGADVLSGGGGDDLLWPGRGRDRLDCGRGGDVVAYPDTAEVLPASCESLSQGDPDYGATTATPRRGTDALRLRVDCAFDGVCRGRVRVYAFGTLRLVARTAREHRARGGRLRLVAPLTAFGRRWLQDPGSHAVTVRVVRRVVEDEIEGRFWNSYPLAWSALLRE